MPGDTPLFGLGIPSSPGVFGIQVPGHGPGVAAAGGVPFSDLVPGGAGPVGGVGPAVGAGHVGVYGAPALGFTHGAGPVGGVGLVGSAGPFGGYGVPALGSAIGRSPAVGASATLGTGGLTPDGIGLSTSRESEEYYDKIDDIYVRTKFFESWLWTDVQLPVAPEPDG